MKKLFSTILAAVLIMGALLPGALAEGDLLISPDLGIVDDVIADFVYEPAYKELTGIVQEINAASGTLTIQSHDGLMVVRAVKSTLILDNGTQKTVAFDAIKTGESIRVWYESATTLGYLPIADASLIVAGIGKDDIALGDYFEVEKVEKTAYGYKLLNQEQDLYYTVPADTAIPVIGSDKAIKPSAIKPGTKLVVWYEIVALSYPGQTGGDKLVALPYDYSGYVSLVGEKLVVNGSKLSVRACETCETYMIPVQAVAKKLGIKTKWDKAAGKLTLTKGAKSVVLTAGKDELIYNGVAAATSAPVLQSGRLYAKMSVLSYLGNYKLANPVR